MTANKHLILSVFLLVSASALLISCGNSRTSAFVPTSAEDTDTPSAVTFITPSSVSTDTPLPQTTDTPLPQTTDTPLPQTTDTPLPPTTDTPLPPTTDTPLPPTTDTPLPPTTDTPLPPTETPIVPFETITGSCVSDTETSLNVYFDYVISEADEGRIRVEITVFLDHYSLFCGSRTDCNSVIIGKDSFIYSTEALHFDAGTGRHHTELTKISAEYEREELQGDLKLSASWLFNGTYSKVPIGLITAETTVTIP